MQTMPRALAGLFASIALFGCPAPVVTPDAGPGVDAGVPDAGSTDAGDPSAALFAPLHLVDVRIELAPADWDTLRAQTRDLFTLLAGDCTAQPFPSPFTTFEGTVTVDGTVLPRSTVKKKGFLGSLSNTRPSLKLKFDSFISGQKVSGQDAMTLNNAQQDPAVMRQCLGYALFAKAGLVAPRCNYAQVRVNGEDLGVYAHVEGIDKDLLKRHFAKSGGNLYEGTLSDFNPTFSRTFDLKGSAGNGADIAAMVTALSAGDAQLLSSLSPILDVDQFIEFWAMETLERHWDGYASNTNNFFIYDDPTSGKFVFIPWGADAVFTSSMPTADNPDGLLLRGELARRLYALPETRTKYLARVRALLDTVFSETALREEVNRTEVLISPTLHPIQRAQFTAGLVDVRKFIDGRRAKLMAVLANPPPAPLTQRPSPCLARLGSLSGSFDTTFGTLNATNPFAVGSGTYQLNFADGGLVPVALVSATAGMDFTGNDGPRVAVNVLALLADGGVGATALRVVPNAYPPPGPVPFDLFTHVGIVFEFQSQQIVPLGLMGTGTMEFTDAGFAEGSRVSGRFSGDLLSWPFGG